MSSIEKLLSFSKGFDWIFQFKSYPNKNYKIILKFLLANVLGDAKGVNILYSKFGNNTTSHIARDYNVLTDVCDNHHYKCNFYK